MRPGLVKSRSLRKTRKRTPGGKVVTHFKRKPHGSPRCAICKTFLSGVIKGSRKTVKNAKKIQRKPTRPYGGVLCPVCTKKVVVIKTKLKNKLIDINDVPISMKDYVKVGEK